MQSSTGTLSKRCGYAQVSSDIARVFVIVERREPNSEEAIQD